MNGGIKMHAVQNLIDTDEKQILFRPFQNGKIIANAGLHDRAGLLARFQPVDEIKFTGHGGIVRDEYLLLDFHSRPDDNLKRKYGQYSQDTQKIDSFTQTSSS
jgi:hypothetical protein